MIVYVAGPYSPTETLTTEANIASAREVAIKLWEAGHVAVCPHLNTAGFEQDCQCLYGEYLVGYLALLERCDAVVMAPNWEQSMGAKVERNRAQHLRMPIYQYPDLPELV